MKNTHMSCPISPQGHCRRGEKNEANFPTCIFRAPDCWLIERPLKEKEIKDKTSCAFISNHDKCALLILHKNLLDWQKGPALK